VTNLLGVSEATKTGGGFANWLDDDRIVFASSTALIVLDV
jgi:hypothetical protein